MKENMKEELIVHWSNSAHKSDVIICCYDGRCISFLDIVGRDLPEGVGCVLSEDDGEKFFSFDPRKVTCKECKKSSDFLFNLEKEMNKEEPIIHWFFSSLVGPSIKTPICQKYTCEPNVFNECLSSICDDKCSDSMVDNSSFDFKKVTCEECKDSNVFKFLITGIV